MSEQQKVRHVYFAEGVQVGKIGGRGIRSAVAGPEKDQKIKSLRSGTWCGFPGVYVRTVGQEGVIFVPVTSIGGVFLDEPDDLATEPEPAEAPRPKRKRKATKAKADTQETEG